MSHLGGGIDELKDDFFVVDSSSSFVDLVSEHQRSLLGSNATSLDHDEVISDNTVMRESSHRGDVLLSQIVLGGSVVGGSFVGGLSDSVDLLSDLSSVVITVVTSSGDSPLGVGWMPGSDTSDSSVTSVSLSWQKSGSPSFGDTGGSVTLGDSQNIDNLSVLENVVDLDFLLKELNGVVNLLSSVSSSVDLDLNDVSGLGAQVRDLFWLGVSNESDDTTVLLDSVNSSLEALVAVLGQVLGEGLLALGSIPVLVVSSQEGLAQSVRPNGGQSSESSWSVDVTDDTDSSHWRGFDDGNGFDDVHLVQTRLWSLKGSGDVGHTSLESAEGGEMWGLGGVIFWETSDLSSVLSGSLSWEETEGSVSWLFEFSMRHFF